MTVAAFPACLLVIEAATSSASVALVRRDAGVVERTLLMGPSRDDLLLPAIDEVLRDAATSIRDVDAVACGSGPGSFTSLRIAAAVAKGLSVAQCLSLHALPSFVLAAIELRDAPGQYLLHSDALRGERYAQSYTVHAGGEVRAATALQRLSLATTEAAAADTGLTLVSVGIKCASALDARSVLPHARNAAHLANSWRRFPPVQIALWEPDYGRLAEAQVKWEATHGRSLASE